MAKKDVRQELLDLAIAKVLAAGKAPAYENVPFNRLVGEMVQETSISRFRAQGYVAQAIRRLRERENEGVAE